MQNLKKTTIINNQPITLEEVTKYSCILVRLST